MIKRILPLVVALVAVGLLVWAAGDHTTVAEHHDLGRAMMEKGQIGPAIVQFSYVIDNDPDNNDAYFQRGVAYLQTGDSDKADDDFSKCIDLDPTNASAFNNRSIIRKAKGDLTSSLADSDSAVALNPNNVGIRHNRADTCFKTGDIDKARADLQAAVSIDPANPYTYHYLAWFYATCPDDNRRDGEKAVDYATKACESSQWKLGFIISTLAAAYAEAGDFDLAVRYETKARELYTPLELERWGDRLQRFTNGETIRDAAIISQNVPNGERP